MEPVEDRDSRDIQAATVWRYEGGQLAESTDALSVEEPLEIRVRGRGISITMRTPGHDEELAVGFLLAEGILTDRSELLGVSPCERNEFGNVIQVKLAAEAKVDLARLTRHVFASSSCGLCGKATLESIAMPFGVLAAPNGPLVTVDRLLTMPASMRQAQGTFAKTGGLHAAALFDAEGTLRLLREDVGRHNALDKVLGHAFLNGWLPLSDNVLLVSGRASFEIMQKALAGGLPFVASVSAPSSLAVDFALRHGQTLIGFLREARMNVYAGPERIDFTER